MKYATWVIVAFIIIVLGSYFLFAGNSTEKETSAIAVEDISAISHSWNAGELEKRADPGLIKAMASQGQSAEDLLKIYSALGKLKEPASCSVKNTNSFMKGGEPHTSISFVCSADYEKGPADISITLSKADKETAWQIYYINIHSDVFGEVIE